MKSTRHVALALALFFSVLLSCVAYFRVFFSEAGFESVGRSWYYFRDYFDFGFAPTSLMGTILRPWMSYPVSDPYLLAWQIQGAILLLLSFLVIFSIIRYVFPVSSAWSVALIASISILPHMAYNLGNLDNVLAILAIVAVLALRYTLIVALICIAGPLFHAMFVFAIYPCLLFLVYHLRGMSRHIAVVAITMFVMFGIIFFGMERAVDEATYSTLMTERAPGLVRNGAFEYFAPVEKSFSVTWQERRDFGFPYLWFALAVSHVLILLVFTVGNAEKLTFGVLRALAFVAPLVLLVFITDIYRLTAWVGFNVMLYGIYLAKYQPDTSLNSTLGERRPGLLLAGVLPWMILGPMGVTCYGDCGATAFPFFKRVIEAF